ncbi:hypothetical protein BDB01DRAFT_839515 [Pilobolus umbonatus]|nr:hypothetical protein BDB01DRAFT_839515 [Pilobolus umbonatus]
MFQDHDTSSHIYEKYKTLNSAYMEELGDLYLSIKDEIKWKLESGRCVEDVLFNYAVQLVKEEAIHSFVLDTTNPHIKELFTDAEWFEIIYTRRKDNPDIQDNIQELLNDLNRHSKILWSGFYYGVRRVLYKYADIRYSDYCKEECFDIDRICNAVELLLYFYEDGCNTLIKKQSEKWYACNLWVPFIDRMFGDLKGIQCRRTFESNKTDMIIISYMNSPPVVDLAASRVVPNYKDFLSSIYFYETKSPTLRIPTNIKFISQALGLINMYHRIKTLQILTAAGTANMKSIALSDMRAGRVPTIRENLSVH